MATEPAPEQSTHAVTESAALKRYLVRHPLITFLLMGLSFLLVGLLSLNLIYLFHANLEFIINNGVMGLRDGGLQQFIELLFSGYLGMMLYLFFKACEKVLVEWVLERKKATVNALTEVDDMNSTQ